MRTCEEQAYVTICKCLGTLKIPPAAVKCVRNPSPVTQKKSTKKLFCAFWCGWVLQVLTAVVQNNRPKRRKKNMLKSTLKSPRTASIWRFLDHWTHWHEECRQLKRFKEVSACYMYSNDHTHRGWNKRSSRCFPNTSTPEITGALVPLSTWG